MTAAALGFGVVLLLEIACRLFGWADSEAAVDPFAGFDRTRPLFTVDPFRNEYVTHPTRLKFFVEDRFPREKGSDVFRIFCIGGSTVQGRPYAKETAFTTWLRFSLESAYPDRRFEVINCGGVSYASYRLVPILTECLGYAPDLVIVGTGHNEFLEDRTYAHYKERAERFGGLYRLASRSHLYRLAHRWVYGSPEQDAGRLVLEEEVDALLDHRGALEIYERDDAWSAGVIGHFAENLERMITLCREAEVPLLMLELPADLKDTPPFKSQRSDGLTAARQEAWTKHTEQAQALYQSDVREAAVHLEKANQIDSRFADHHYALGQCLLALGRSRKAKSSFERALEEDVCPLRMLPTMREVLREACEEGETPLIDLDALLAAECAFAILGQEILVDHVHPSIEGHQLVAARLHAELAHRFRFGAPAASWEERRDRRYREHLESLSPLYFAHGKRRLDNLRAWTEGRADGPPLPRR